MTTELKEFMGFPKISRLSRDCIITDLTSSEFSPYFKYGNNNQVPELRNGVQPPVSWSASKVLLPDLPITALDIQQSREAKLRSAEVSSKEIRRGRTMAGRGAESQGSKGMDGEVEIQPLPRLRRSVRGLLHGLRPQGWNEESLQFRKHVRASLRARTYRTRIGKVRFSLCKLPQSQNTK